MASGPAGERLARTEVDVLIAPVAGALVVGVSGGATLGLELAARGVGFRAAVLHEPAVGSLLPGLLDGVAAAYGAGAYASSRPRCTGRAGGRNSRRPIPTPSAATWPCFARSSRPPAADSVRC